MVFSYLLSAKQLLFHFFSFEVLEPLLQLLNYLALERAYFFSFYLDLHYLPIFWGKSLDFWEHSVKLFF
jgi:hypothetical protein